MTLRSSLRLTAGLSFIALVSACSGGSSVPSSEASKLADGGAGDGSAASSPSADASSPVASTTVLIDFDDLTTDADVTTQFAEHVVFSSDAPAVNRAVNPLDLGQSKPNFLSTWMFPTEGGHASTYLDFARPVANVRFNALGVDNDAVVAHVRVLKGKEVLGVVDIVGAGTNRVPIPVDLSAWSGITRIEIIDVKDLGGIGLDDFRFDFPD
jgi:hypothetical protein